MKQFLAIIFILLSAHLAAAEWTPRLDNLEDQLKLLASFYQTHPELPKKNLAFKRNPLDTVRPTAQLLEQLESLGNSVIQDSEIFGVTYSTNGKAHYDEEGLKLLKQELIDLLDTIKLDKFESIEADLMELKDLARKNYDPKLFPKRFKRDTSNYIKLLPFLYDASETPLYQQLDQNSLRQIRTAIEAANPNDLDNLYQDLFTNHFHQKLQQISQGNKMGTVAEALGGIENQFIAKTVKKATTPIFENNGPASIRTISLEKVPNILTPFRGNVGNDCSILSVPYYGLLKDSEVYWIRKSSSPKASPAGYLFVTQVQVSGQKIPYVITTNGVTLTEDDIKEAIKIYADKKKVSTIVVPDFQKNRWVVNTEAMRRGLSFPTSQAQEVEMPPGWDLISKYQDENAPKGYRNFYATEEIKYAQKVDLELDRSNILEEVYDATKPRYAITRNFEEMPVINRSILAAHALRDSNDANDILQIKTLLEVTDEQIEAANFLTSISYEDPLTYQKFEILNTRLGFEIDDLSDLDMISRGYSIRNIYQENKQLTSEENWKNIAQKHSKELKKEIDDLLEVIEKEGYTTQNGSTLLRANESLLSIPDHLNDHYLDDIFYFLAKDSYPDKQMLLGQAFEYINSKDNVALFSQKIDPSLINDLDLMSLDKNNWVKKNFHQFTEKVLSNDKISNQNKALFKSKQFFDLARYDKYFPDSIAPAKEVIDLDPQNAYPRFALMMENADYYGRKDTWKSPYSFMSEMMNYYWQNAANLNDLDNFMELSKNFELEFYHSLQIDASFWKDLDKLAQNDSHLKGRIKEFRINYLWNFLKAEKYNTDGIPHAKVLLDLHRNDKYQVFVTLMDNAHYYREKAGAFGWNTSFVNDVMDYYWSKSNNIKDLADFTNRISNYRPQFFERIETDAPFWKKIRQLSASDSSMKKSVDEFRTLFLWKKIYCKGYLNDSFKPLAKELLDINPSSQNLEALLNHIKKLFADNPLTSETYVDKLIGELNQHSLRLRTTRLQNKGCAALMIAILGAK